MKCVETFLRIERSLLSDVAPEADADWLRSRGIEPEALDVVRLVRAHVVPLVAKFNLLRYVLLIHGSLNGVPTSVDDPHAYLHLRIIVPSDVACGTVKKKIMAPWTMTRISTLSSDMAGVDTVRLPIDRAWQLLADQSRWFVESIASHDASVSDFQVLKHLRQFLHFFANMAQMRVA